MARKSKLTEEIIEFISEKRKRRLTWKQIGGMLGIPPETLHRWMAQGKKATRKSPYRNLYRAVEKADAQLLAKASDVISDALFNGSKTITKKTVVMQDGKIRTEIVEKTEPPDADFALKIAERIDPATWGQHHHIKVDWQKPVKELGLDPKQAEQAFFKFLELHQGEADDPIIIPEVPGRKV